jgi:hypothetical protein
LVWNGAPTTGPGSKQLLLLAALPGFGLLEVQVGLFGAVSAGEEGFGHEQSQTPTLFARLRVLHNESHNFIECSV